MTQEMMVAGIVGFLLPVFTLSSGVIVHDIYCDYTKNEFYLPQGDLCKKCDRCPPGFGLEPIKDMTVEIGPVHGAMGCRRCVHCSDGHYSKFRSYKECKVCRNCALEGRAELRKCTDTSNAKCGGSLLSSRNEKVTDTTIKSETDPNSPSVLETGSEVVPLLIVVTALAAMGLAVLVMFCLLRKQSHSDSCIIIKIDGLRRNFHNEEKPMLKSESVNVACDDVDIDGELHVPSVFHEWKLKNGSVVTLSSKHTLYLSKPLAPDNMFHKLGIRLGIHENEIAIIKTDYSSNIADQAYHTLEKWQHMMGDSATVLKVLNSLLELNRYDIVEKFCKEYP